MIEAPAEAKFPRGLLVIPPAIPVLLCLVLGFDELTQNWVTHDYVGSFVLFFFAILAGFIALLAMFIFVPLGFSEIILNSQTRTFKNYCCLGFATAYLLACIALICFLTNK